MIYNLVRAARFWNNHHLVRSKSKDWKSKMATKTIFGNTQTKGRNKRAKKIKT
jgi:hypothetical protein